MPIINTQANPSFFGAASQAYERGADRGTEMLMQEKQLQLQKEAQKLREQEFKHKQKVDLTQLQNDAQRIQTQAQQQEFQRAMGRREALLRQQQFQHGQSMDELQFALENKYKTAQIALMESQKRGLDNENAMLAALGPINQLTAKIFEGQMQTRNAMAAQGYTPDQVNAVLGSPEASLQSMQQLMQTAFAENPEQSMDELIGSARKRSAIAALTTELGVQEPQATALVERLQAMGSSEDIIEELNATDDLTPEGRLAVVRALNALDPGLGMQVMNQSMLGYVTENLFKEPAVPGGIFTAAQIFNELFSSKLVPSGN